MQDLPEFIGAQELAKLLGVSNNTVRLWRVKGRGPKFIQRGYSRYFYRREDVLTFMKEYNFDIPE